MSYDIQLDTATHDLVIATNGDIQLLNEARRVAQQVKVTLLVFLGEWFLDTSFGVPYLENIMVKSPRWTMVETILRGRIMNVPGVQRIQSLKLDIDRANRTLSVTFECNTPFGLTGPHNVGLTLRAPT